MSTENGSTIICRKLKELGVELVFALPGSQNIHLFEALRRSRLRTVTATHELAAAFMANGYARASGRVGVLNTISGPGFACALAGLAEASLDSVPLLYIVNRPVVVPGRRFNHQEIDQAAIAQPIVRRTYQVDRLIDLERTLEYAYHRCLSEEPGPVLVQVADQVLSSSDSDGRSAPAGPLVSQTPAAPSVDLINHVLNRIAGSGRIVFYCGQGANNAAQEVRELAKLLEAPVITTRSARGLIPEDHPLSIVFNPDGGGVHTLNRFIERCDLVLALGCKLSHNGSAGFALRIPAHKLVRVDTSQEVLDANYEAETKMLCTVEDFLAGILKRSEDLQTRSAGWEPQELECSRREITEESGKALTEPRFHGMEPPTAAAFFAALREAMPRNACLVTDCGLHQVMARVHFRALSPRSLIVPSDLQSVGFGLPAAIGAVLADPNRPVVALVGDGGMAMSGMELITAVREGVPLTVIVFNDRALGQIRLHQITAFGAEHGTSLMNPDFEMLAASLGASYIRLEGDAKGVLSRAIQEGGVSLVEVVLGDSAGYRVRRAAGLVRGAGRRVMGSRLERFVRRRMGKNPS